MEKSGAEMVSQYSMEGSRKVKGCIILEVGLDTHGGESSA